MLTIVFSRVAYVCDSRSSKYNFDMETTVQETKDMSFAMPSQELRAKPPSIRPRDSFMARLNKFGLKDLSATMGQSQAIIEQDTSIPNASTGVKFNGFTRAQGHD